MTYHRPTSENAEMHILRHIVYQTEPYCPQNCTSLVNSMAQFANSMVVVGKIKILQMKTLIVTNDLQSTYVRKCRNFSNLLIFNFVLDICWKN